ncbi:MAG: DUF5702 domain-containing protein [Lachnospiraceae bacterium]|nr:DUF5702 domain-containing protein [Lachnospiraceae bacterium]
MQTVFNPDRPKDSAGRAGAFPKGTTVFFGGTTVFFCLTLISLMAVFFTLAEGIRVLALNRSCDRITENSTNAVFSRFVDCLWTDYGILGVDLTCAGQDTSGQMLADYGLSYAQQSGNPGKDIGVTYLRLNADSCQIRSYGLLTDQGGTPFLRMAAETALEDIPEELLQKKTEEIQEGQEISDSSESIDQLLDNGDQALKNVKKQEEKKQQEAKAAANTAANTAGINASAHSGAVIEAGGAGEELTPQEKARREAETKKWEGVSNPIPMVREWKSKDILELLLPQDCQVSEKTLGVEDLVSKRHLNQGNKTAAGLSPVDRILCQQYAKSHLGWFMEPLESGSLAYGSEYLIAGKNSDRENLKATALRILAMREGQNLISIMKDEEKKNLARSFASVLSAFSGEALELPIELAILAAWAFVESVLDLRALFAGEKVPIVKSKEEWKSSLENLGKSMAKEEKSNGSDHGLNYEAYLGILFLTLTTEKMGLRSLDLIEADIRTRQGYESIRMDRLVYSADLEWEYHASPVFLSFVPNISGGGDLYDYKRQKSFSYLKE